MNRLLKVCLSSVLLLAGTAALPSCNGARDNALNMVGQSGDKLGFNIRTITRGDRTRKYGLFVPLNYKADHAYPVIIFLHGMGEGGGDAHANMRVGLAPFVADRAQDFPFIVIFPQSEGGGWNENSQAAQDIFTALDEVAKQYNVNRDMVSLTGLSTGGYGTWVIGATHTDVFAALVPMGSNAQCVQYVDKLKNMPIRAYHNGGDPFAAVWNDETMCNKVNAAGGHADFTRTNDGGHDCWDGVYADGELFTWLLQQHRRPQVRTSATTVMPAQARTNAAISVTTPY